MDEMPHTSLDDHLARHGSTSSRHSSYIWGNSWENYHRGAVPTVVMGVITLLLQIKRRFEAFRSVFHSRRPGVLSGEPRSPRTLRSWYLGETASAQRGWGTGTRTFQKQTRF